MDALERLAEAQIADALARGELDDLPGAGRPLDLDDGMELVAPELRAAYRLLRNAGYLPEEVLLRREIADVRELLAGACRAEERLRLSRRLELLLYRVGGDRALELQLQEDYYRSVVQRVGD